jgi:thioredoxin 1
MEITDKEFKKEILDSGKLAMVDFWATWCMPCQMLKPVTEEIAKEVGDKAMIRAMDVDENPETAKTYNVMSIPTVLFFKDGELVDTVVGVHPKETYTSIIDELSTGGSKEKEVKEK